jgi:hypothetical protein
LKSFLFHGNSKCKTWEELIFVIFTPINKLIKIMNVDEIKVDEIKVDELKVDELKVDELKVDELKVNGIKVDELNVDEKFLSRRTDLARHLGSSSLFDLIHKSM